MSDTSIERGISDLEWLLGYELRMSTRYRRFVSLVMVSSDDIHSELGAMLGSTIRESDAFFSVDDATVVLMARTDTEGASRAVERYKDSLDGALDMRFSVACFPIDGRAPSDLIDAASERMKKARTMGQGAVVCAG